MDIYFLGLTSVRLRGRKTTIVIDPFDKESLQAQLSKETKGDLAAVRQVQFEPVAADAILRTHRNSQQAGLSKVSGFRVVIEGPGEYEVGGVGIIGIQLGQVTTYCVKMDGIVLLHLGSLTKTPTDSDLDKYPNIDVVFVPVGHGPADFIAKLEPKIVIPINFTKGIETTVTSFAGEFGKEGIRPQSRLSLTKEKLPQELEVVWLN